MKSPEEALEMLNKAHSDREFQRDNSAALNPGKSVDQSNKRNGKTNVTPNLAQRLKAAEQQIASMKDAQSKRREHTPVIGVKNDTVQLEFEGKIAGKTTTRATEILTGDQVHLLAPLIAPIVHMMNAALRGHDIENHVKATTKGSDGKSNVVLDDHGKPMYTCDWMIKARYAYDLILTNPQICEKLEQINEILQESIAKGKLPLAGQLEHDIPQSVANSSKVGDTMAYILSQNQDGPSEDDQELTL